MCGLEQRGRLFMTKSLFAFLPFCYFPHETIEKGNLIITYAVPSKSVIIKQRFKRRGCALRVIPCRICPEWLIQRLHDGR